MGIGCNYVDTLPEPVLEELECIAGARPDRWHIVLPKLTSQQRLLFGQVAMGRPVERVWIEREHLETTVLAICAEW